MHFLLQAVILASLRPFVFAASGNSESSPLQQPLSDSSDQSRIQILNPEVDATINSILKDFNSPGGVGVAVVQKDKHEWRVETKGYGVAKVDGTRVTADTLFGIGSNSKLFDILATGLLISNDSLSARISWNTKIASLVPEWGLVDPVASAESTIVDVMSHRTGLPRHDLIPLSDTVLNIIRHLKYLRPSTGFRELYQYNNHMYTLLSYLPPLLTGIPFEKYVHDFILEPLGMHSTTYSSERAAESGNIANGMTREGVNQTEDVFGLGRVRALPYWAPSKDGAGHSFSGPGGLISSTNDMAIWLQVLLSEGRHPVNNEVVIPAEVIRQVATGFSIAAPVAPFPELSPVVYGGGQTRGSYRGFEFIEHGGSTPGFKSQIARIPNANIGVAVFSNDESFGTEIVSAINFHLVDEALKLETIDWSARLRYMLIAEFNGKTIPTPWPTNATLPSLPFDALAATYHDPGYGTIDLCLVSPNSQCGSSTSESCRQLLEETPTTLPDIINPKIPTLLARWSAIRVTHLSFVHFEHNVFNVSGLFSVLTGNCSDKPYWVSVEMESPSFVAEFSSDGVNGVGIRGLWGAGEGVPSPKGDTVKSRAEVWFNRLDKA